MKILTWNVFKNNKKIDDAVDFLKKQNADIICLQEYPAEKMVLLDALNMQLVAEDEVLEHKNTRKKSVQLKTVIATRLPIDSQSVISHKNIYNNITKPINRYKNFKADSLFIDVAFSDTKYRIFNMHLKCVASPYHRLSQFKEILENLSKERENIICGDFNTFGKSFMNIFLWKYFGYKFKEVRMHEKKIFTILFDLYQLKNVFRGSITFWKFPVQLDYILVPTHMKVLHKKRLKLNGSDHFPLVVEI